MMYYPGDWKVLLFVGVIAFVFVVFMIERDDHQHENNGIATGWGLGESQGLGVSPGLRQRDYK